MHVDFTSVWQLTSGSLRSPAEVPSLSTLDRTSVNASIHIFIGEPVSRYFCWLQLNTRCKLILWLRVTKRVEQKCVSWPEMDSTSTIGSSVKSIEDEIFGRFEKPRSGCQMKKVHTVHLTHRLESQAVLIVVSLEKVLSLAYKVGSMLNRAILTLENLKEVDSSIEYVPSSLLKFLWPAEFISVQEDVIQFSVQRWVRG